MLRSRLSSPAQLVLEAPRLRWDQLQYGFFAFLCAAGFAGAVGMALLPN
jgi:hypothetical protein